MSYFPSADPQKLREGYYSTPPMHPFPAGPHPNHPSYGGLPITSAAEGAIYSDPHGLTWHHPQHATGLGVVPMPGSTGQMVHNTLTAMNSVGNTFGWRPENAVGPSQHMGYASPVVGNEHWSESCEMTAPLMPSAPMWDPQAGFSTQDPYSSPGRSDYSTSTQASDVSSPYAQSGGRQVTAGSPLVKQEDVGDFGASPYNYVHDAPIFDPAMSLHPTDIVTRTSCYGPTQGITSSLPMRPAQVDVKPVISPPRHHRTISMKSVHNASEASAPRPRRTYTKPEAANCSCETCGKGFQRSYNLRAHMETHDPDRSHPHECEHDGCSKKFVRKTDLLRHVESVHSRTRNYVCELCGGAFARRDTLRRHVDDGCPRRTEVRRRATRVNRSASASSLRRSSQQSLQSSSSQASQASSLRKPL